MLSLIVFALARISGLESTLIELAFTRTKQIINSYSLITLLTGFVFIIILSPLLEEIIYRGLIYPQYRKKYGIKTALIISSLIFMFSHTGGKHFDLTLLLIGVLFAYLYEKRESLIPSLSMHIFFNLNLFVLYLYAIFEEKIGLTISVAELFQVIIIIYLFLSISFACYFYLERRKRIRLGS